LPTDRCYAEWWIASDRVKSILADEGVGRGPGGPPHQAISYPADIARIRAEDPRRARQIQKENGEKFRRAFHAGLAVTRFARGETEGSYLLEPWQ
jgi:predicted GNAT superfamily acetyltransferase